MISAGRSAELELLPDEVKAAGWKPSQKRGWNGLAKGQYVAYRQDAGRDLKIGLVLHNDRAEQVVELHTCSTFWENLAVVHRLEYLLPADMEGGVALDSAVPGALPSKAMVHYSALIKVVEL